MTQLEIMKDWQYESDEVNRRPIRSIFWTDIYSHAINRDKLIGPSVRKLKWANQGYKEDYWVVSLGKLVSMTEIDLSNSAISIPAQPEGRVKLAPKVLRLTDVRFQMGELGRMAITQINEIINFGTLETLFLRYEMETINLNLSDCANVKNLFLSGVTIDLDPNTKISCEKLHLDHNQYFLNGEQLQEFQLNDYFRPGTRISEARIESRECALDFDSIFVEKLTTCRMSWIDMTNLNRAGIKQLDIRAPCARTLEIDLALLPATIEILRIQTSYCNISCSQPISLPNLKYVHLKGGFSALPHLQNCPALVDLVLLGCTDTDNVFYVQHLPPSVKRLTLLDFGGIMVEGVRNLKLDVLVISNIFGYEISALWRTALQFANKLFVDSLVLFHNNEQHSHSAILFNERQVLLGKRISEAMQIGKISVGPVLWESDRDEWHGNDPPPHFAGSKAKYLLLENQERKDISEEEFMGVLPFGEDAILDWDLHMDSRDM